MPGLQLRRIVGLRTVGRRWLGLGAVVLLGGTGPMVASTATPKPIPTPPTAAQPVLPFLTEAATVANLGWDGQLWGENGQRGDRWALLRAINYSLRYLDSDKGRKDYAEHGALSGVSRARVIRSLQRFRQLVREARSPQSLQAAVAREFELHQAAGKDGQGTVAFTGYFEPVHQASRVPTAEYRYPLFRRPPNFADWAKPHPTRADLEGTDGLQFRNSPLRGLELVWLRDRLEAYLIQVQGSARLKLTDGGTLSVGYAGRTDFPYVSIGKELVQDGVFPANELTLPRLLQYFRDHPQALNRYLPRNNRFIFFKETGGRPATGSLRVPVTPERSIATDKSLFPPGALALIHTQIPYRTASGNYEMRLVSRYVLDQDTGGAIKGPGRVDIFMGTGQTAGDRAGLINHTGKLYYLLLKE